MPRERLGAAERMRYGLRRWGLPAARVAGLLAVLILGALVVREAADGRIFMLQRLEMTGDVQKVPLARLKEAVEPAAAGKTFFTVDLKAVRDAAETVPWVQYAAVRRVWPDALMIDVTVYEAAAVYEDGRLVSGEGQLFRPILMKDRKRPALQHFAGRLRPYRKCFAAGADSAD